MINYDFIDELERVIKLVCAFPRGSDILLGNVPPPTSSDMVRAFPLRACDNLGIRGEPVPEAEIYAMAASRIDEIVRKAGGWKNITAAIRQWRNENAEDWDIVTDYISIIGARKRGRIKRLVNKYGYSERTIQRKHKHFAGRLAEYISFCPLSVA